MAATPESRVKARVVAVLKGRGIYYFYPMSYGMGRSGVPDLVCCANGRFLAIECKANGKKPTAIQEAEIALIRRAGGTVLVINENNIGELEAALQELGYV